MVVKSSPGLIALLERNGVKPTGDKVSDFKLAYTNGLARKYRQIVEFDPVRVNTGQTTTAK